MQLQTILNCRCPNAFFVFAQFAQPTSPWLQKGLLTLSYVIVLATVNLLRSSYPLIFGFIAGNVLSSVSCILLTEYFLARSLNPKNWIQVRLKSFSNVVYYLISSIISCLLGAGIGGVIIYKTAKDLNRPLAFIVFKWATTSGFIFSVGIPLLLAIKEQGHPRNWKVRISAKNVLLLAVIVAQPLIIWGTTSSLANAYSTVMGLYISFPLVLTVFLYGGELVGMITISIIYISSIVFLFVYKKDPILDSSNSATDQLLSNVIVFLIVMSIASLVINSIMAERDEAMATIETKVKQRTLELQTALAELKQAKADADLLSRQKSEFMVR